MAIKFAEERTQYLPTFHYVCANCAFYLLFYLITIFDTYFFFPDHQNKTPTIADYKSNSSCSSPSKDVVSSKDRSAFSNTHSFGRHPHQGGPVLPLRRPTSSHFPPNGSGTGRFHFRKGLASRCTWRCAAVAFITLSVVLTAALSYISG